jgi:hypothetical protein
MPLGAEALQKERERERTANRTGDTGVWLWGERIGIDNQRPFPLGSGSGQATHEATPDRDRDRGPSRLCFDLWLAAS